jgi:hypothetical protein
MNVLGLIGQIFKPAMDMIDNVHTSTEEKLEQKAKLLDLQVNFMERGLEYELAQLEAKSRIIEAEAKSDHFLTATWRPVTMLVFLGLVVCDQFGLLTFRLAEQAWTLLQIGLGGYVVGRSVEKVVPAMTKAMKKKEET